MAENAHRREVNARIGGATALVAGAALGLAAHSHHHHHPCPPKPAPNVTVVVSILCRNLFPLIVDMV